MDDIPAFQLAKVGKNRERRRGGAAWLGGSGVGSAFSGAAGGAGAGLSAAKVLSVLLVSGILSAGAWQVGSRTAGSSSSAAAQPVAKKIFTDKEASGSADVADAISTGKSIPNSLGYVNDDGLTDEQRAAKKAAAAEAARKAEEDAKSQAVADAKKQADAEAEANKKADADAAKQGADPAAMAAAAGAGQGANAGLAPGKFGGMSSSFSGHGGSGGLPGGAGLSGGIGHGFGGAGALGGSKGRNGGNGALGAFQAPAQASMRSASAQNRAKSNAKGFAQQQLGNAFTAGRSAVASGQNETSSAGNTAPFDNGANAGNVIAGPGIGGGKPQATGGGGGTEPNPGGNVGGPIDAGPNGAACTGGMQPDINGNCQSIAVPTAKAAAPYQGLIDMAKALMALTAILSMIVLWCWFVASGPITNPVLVALALHISTIIKVLGVMILALGLGIMAMSGDKAIGGIVTAVGAMTIATAFIPGFAGQNSIVTVSAGALITSAIGMLATSSASKSHLN